MDNDETQVVDTTTEETVTEAEDTGVDTEDTQETTEDIDWKERALKAEKTIEKAKAKAKDAPKEKKAEGSDEVTIARLEARGILHPDDQAYVLKFAKNEDMHYLEALEDELVKDKLDRNKKLRLSAQAAPRGNNRAPGAQNDVDAAVKKFEKDGTLPDNPALIAKVMKALKTR
jgi:hypothetical protein